LFSFSFNVAQNKPYLPINVIDVIEVLVDPMYSGRSPIA